MINTVIRIDKDAATELTKYSPTIDGPTLDLGTVYRIIVPMIGTAEAIINVAERRLCHLAASVEKTNADSVDMIPVGMDSNDACFEVNPKFLMIIALKVVRPGCNQCLNSM